MVMSSTKPIVLHIGDPVKWNNDQYEQFAKDFTVIRPSSVERERDLFKKGLKEKTWGDFNAIFRPFWNTGGEMGRVSSSTTSKWKFGEEGQALLLGLSFETFN